MNYTEFKEHPEDPGTCANCACKKDLHDMNVCPHIDMKIDPVTAMCVIGNIQLATRHPANNGPSLRFAIQFARDLEKELVKLMPDREAIFAMGWDPQYDLP